MGTMNKRISGLLILLAGYIVAIGASVGLYFGLAQAGLDLFLNLLICDVAATIIIWLFGVLFKTASFYDPYWSVQTFVMVLAILISSGNWNAGTILFLVALAYYTVRLTGNFIRTFHSLRYVDWRYEMLREKSGKLFQIVNLMGICMFPTLIVYLASIPALYVALGNFSWWQIIGFVVMVGAVTLELISDKQMTRFVKTRTDRSQVINVGLWRFSRHPNYLGEISFWFGVYFFFLAEFKELWYWGAGAIAILLMFLFISIPMEEKRMATYKPGLAAYKKRANALLLLPERKPKEPVSEE